MEVESQPKQKKQSFLKRLFSSRESKRVSRAKTIIKIKTVGDIPPIAETRKLLGDGRIKKAIVTGYNYAKNDYMRFFSVSTDRSETNRQFIIRSLTEIGVEVPEYGYVDNHAIMDSMNSYVLTNISKSEKFNALKKLTSFYLEYYERTRFSENWNPDSETIIQRLEDIYSYMDIMKLYYAEVEKQVNSEDTV